MQKQTQPPLRPARFGGLEFQYIGGDSVLDFHNTVAWPRGKKSNERLRRPVDLIRWGKEARVIANNETRMLVARATRNGRRSRQELVHALALRDDLHSILTAALVGNSDSMQDSWERLNARLKKVRAAQRLEPRTRSAVWSEPTSEGTNTIIDRITLAAARLLTSDDLRRLRRCANPECGWLFIDRTRNGYRKWCSMAECGGRAKSRRYYDRKRKSG